MNKRIQELAEQAFAPINDIASEGIADRSTFNMHWFQLYNQKFAELIVKECVCVADAYIQTGERARPTSRSSIGRLIKEHFGAEE